MYLGIEIEFEGEGVQEIGRVAKIHGELSESLKVGTEIIKIDPMYFRPSEVETLLGDPSKAKSKLGWSPEISLDEMIKEMIEYDLDLAKRHVLLKNNGFNSLVGADD
jgi:GDPmannose 4,6-dehydratase